MKTEIEKKNKITLMCFSILPLDFVEARNWGPSGPHMLHLKINTKKNSSKMIKLQIYSSIF